MSLSEPERGEQTETIDDPLPATHCRECQAAMAGYSKSAG